MTAPVLVLFRDDLRVSDNGALLAASRDGRPVVAAFILDETSSGIRPWGGAARWWLHHSVTALGVEMGRLGLTLAIRHGPAPDVIDELIEETGADTVYWNRRYDPAKVAVDTRMKSDLRERGVRVESFDGHLLHEPSRLRTGSGTPYKVFTPFWNALNTGPEPRDPTKAPAAINAFGVKLRSESLEALLPLPVSPDWAGGLRESWTPGEAGAQERLADFLSISIDGYGEKRDFPDVSATSLLAPHLAHGEITPYQIFAAIREQRPEPPVADAVKFRKELGWREFCHHQHFHNPDLHQKNVQPAFDGFDWRFDADLLRAWQRGATGYPIVDAGMRQLWQTGTMHNRVRMITASFLTKHLLIDWRHGERWFWDTLVDADPANNPANWQWVAGCGADAAPYFRIFNPVLQGEKFDADGAYVRSFVPELAGMPARYIHKPWQAPAQILSQAAVRLGVDYPLPIVEHSRARERALAAYAASRS